MKTDLNASIGASMDRLSPSDVRRLLRYKIRPLCREQNINYPIAVNVLLGIITNIPIYNMLHDAALKIESQL
jgi:hypothetical protein